MNGIELAIRFSYVVNSLRYCGPESEDDFLKYLNGESNEEEVKELFKKFEGFRPYMQLTSEKTGKDMFDYDVIEAYWLGNSLLDEFDGEDMKKIVEMLVTRGLPKSIGDELVKNMPAEAFPHHSFHVMYVGPGRTTGTVPTNMDTMSKCIASEATVVEVNEGELVVKTCPLDKKDDKFVFGEEIEKKVKWKKEITPSIKVGDKVALHWDFAGLVLTERQVENLKKYTKQTLDTVNNL